MDHGHEAGPAHTTSEMILFPVHLETYSLDCMRGEGRIGHIPMTVSGIGFRTLGVN
jgi:hypothetical protein